MRVIKGIFKAIGFIIAFAVVSAVFYVIYSKVSAKNLNNFTMESKIVVLSEDDYLSLPKRIVTRKGEFISSVNGRATTKVYVSRTYYAIMKVNSSLKLYKGQPVNFEFGSNGTYESLGATAPLKKKTEGTHTVSGKIKKRNRYFYGVFKFNVRDVENFVLQANAKFYYGNGVANSYDFAKSSIRYDTQYGGFDYMDDVKSVTVTGENGKNYIDARIEIPSDKGGYNGNYYVEMYTKSSDVAIKLDEADTDKADTTKTENGYNFKCTFTMPQLGTKPVHIVLECQETEVYSITLYIKIYGDDGVLWKNSRGSGYIRL